MQIRKAIQLATLLPRRPVEFFDRLATVVELKMDRRAVEQNDYNPKSWDDLLQELDSAMDSRCSTYAQEHELKSIEAQVRERQRSIAERSPFASSHDGGIPLGRLCYVVARATKPEVLIETGVAHGVTSAFILKALSVNGIGRLHSIDLPPLGADGDRFVGCLIPEELRNHWQLYRGTSKRELPKLLQQLGTVSFFVHDSLHTMRTMDWEFTTIQPFLESDGVVIADDIESNRAFADWSFQRHSRISSVLGGQDKKELVGISVGHESS